MEAGWTWRWTLLTALFLLAGVYQGHAQADSALIKTIAGDSVTAVMLDQDTVRVDAYGSTFVPNAWFIISVSPGEHIVRFLRRDGSVVERLVTVAPNEIATVDIREQPAPPAETPAVDSTDMVPMRITSDPDTCRVIIDTDTTTWQTPCTVLLTPGQHRFEISCNDWQSLVDTINIPAEGSDGLHILLKAAPPAPFSPESQGLSYQMEFPLLDLHEVTAIKDRFSQLAETFAVFPLAQGAVFKGVLADDAPDVANAMLISGIVLTGGSLLLGNVLSEHKRAGIEKRNAEITEQNAIAGDANAEVDRALRKANQDAYRMWVRQNADRGRIIVRRK